MKLFSFSILVTVTTVIQVSPSSATCIITSYSGVAEAVKSCISIILKDIVIPAKTTLSLDLLTGASLTFSGMLRWEADFWDGPLMKITGQRVTVDGPGATLDGQGAKYWDGQGGRTTKKPVFVRIKTTGGSMIKNIKIKNCPLRCVSINSANFTVLDNVNIDISEGFGVNGGHNTDGFDLSSSSDITIQNSKVENQDDCVAANQGSNYFIYNVTCIGGHGLSVSVGQSNENGIPNTLRNVTYSRCTVINSDNGIHVKTHVNAGTGSITDLKYDNIILSGINKFGINVQQDYINEFLDGIPKNNIPITNLTMNSVTGSMAGGPNGMSVYIMCAAGGCKNWPWSNVRITNSKKNNTCTFQPTGFTC